MSAVDLAADLSAPADLGPLPPDLRAPDPTQVCSVDSWCWENPQPHNNGLNAMWALDENNVWAVGEFGTVVKWNGKNWIAQSTGIRQGLLGIWGLDANNIWAVGEAGAIVKWDGASWTTQPSGTTRALFGVWAADANNAWASGQNGTIVNGDYDPPIRTYTDPRMEMSCTLPASPTGMMAKTFSQVMSDFSTLPETLS